MDEDDLATLHRDGVLIKRGFFDSDEIGLLKAACAKDQALARHTIHQSDTEGRRFVLTDIPQIASWFAEIIPPCHRRGNGTISAATR